MTTRPRGRRTLAVAALPLLAGALLAACSTPSPSAQPSGSALSQAIALAPADTAYLGVTDWSQVKTSAGHGNVTSQSPIADRSATYKDVLKSEGEVSQFVADTSAPDQDANTLPSSSAPPNQLSPQAQTWGFDALDLDWDATVVAGQGQYGVLLLHLRSGVDTGQIDHHFDQNGFKRKDVAGLTVRTLGGPLFAGPPGTSPAMSNSALLKDGRTLAISQSLDELTAFLRGLGGAAPPEMAAAAGQLGTSWASAIIGGTHACGYFDPPAGWDLDSAYASQIQGEISSVGNLSPFQAVGMGYSRKQNPIGQLTFIFPSATDAAHDVNGRQALAQQARRMAPGHETYATSLFTVSSAGATGNALTLRLQPVGDQPLKLFQAFGNRDLIPAVCHA